MPRLLIVLVLLLPASAPADGPSIALQIQGAAAVRALIAPAAREHLAAHGITLVEDDADLVLRFTGSGTRAGGHTVVAISALVVRADDTLAQTWLFVGKPDDIGAFIQWVVFHFAASDQS